MMKSKRKSRKFDFEDSEIFNEIKDQIREIQERGLKQIEEDMEIMNLYNQKINEKKRRKILAKENVKPILEEGKKHRDNQGLGQDDEEEGEINQKNLMVDEGAQKIPTIREIGDYIRPITLTRNKVCGMLKSRKFQEVVKGCFVRYKAENSGPTSNAYLLAQIVSVTESEKQYYPNKSIHTRVLLKLQQSSDVIITLTIDHLSNQHPPGVLQIQKWLQTNRNKIPREKQLKEKKKELQNFMFGKISSEEIDHNIYDEAKKVAFKSEEVKSDISKLIYFTDGQLHDHKVKLQELEGDKLEEKQKIEEGIRQCQQILQILRKKRTEYFEQQRNKQKEEKQRTARKKYSQLFFEDRKEDRIKKKHNEWISQFYSFQGGNKNIQQIKSIHEQFNFDMNDD